MLSDSRTFGSTNAPTRQQSEAGFATYRAEVARIGGSIFAIERDSNDLYTWAQKLPGRPFAEAQHTLEARYDSTFRDVEIAYVKAVLGVAG